MARHPQHKPARDERKSKELGDLKRENVQLQRKLARAEKTIAKLKGNEPEPSDFDSLVKAPVVKAPTCKHCSSANVKSMTTPLGTLLLACFDCSRSSVVKAAEPE